MKKNPSQTVLQNCKTKILMIVLLLLGINTVVKAQSVGINTLTPDASAALDIQSTTGGLLIPRMTSAEIAALVSPADGLMVYNTELENTMMFVQGSPFALYNRVTTSAITILTGLAPSVWLNVSDLAPTEFLGLDIHRFRLDLTDVKEIRVIANVTGLSLGLGGSLDVVLQYSVDGITWNVINGTTFGPELSISVNGLVTTSWTEVDALARQDVQLRLVGQASGGVVTQAGFGLVMVEFK